MTADDFLAGQTLLIDKPLQWSSFQAVNKIKYVLKSKFGLKNLKIGHAGTLDPLATGLLVICTGKSTKIIANIQADYKEYTGTLRVGATTPSYDMETRENQTFGYLHITPDLVNEKLAEFTGRIMQKPPVFSAIKKDGKRLYEHARAGEEVEVNPRPVDVYEFEITRFELPEIDFRIKCGKGTYIRSIAHDFGAALGSGAYLTALRRTRIGAYDVK
ncbi:MAG TPA: tRNA pseudouridine(55) synthase TruB, partial [Flavobacterium sp.]|nr:tRNA pseudouridine(55) synthase TruB [Flavobacterium sp.]